MNLVNDYDSDKPQPPDEGEPPTPPRQHLSARVPEAVGPGIFSTGAVVLNGATEIVLDFFQTLGHPSQVAARIVLPLPVLPQLIDALGKNIELYQNQFGQIPEVPGAKSPRQLTMQEIYDELKIPDERLAGAYANGVMIMHNATDFKFDFLTNLYPQPAVSSRIFLSAPQVPRLLKSLQQHLEQMKLRQQGGKPPPAPEEDPDPDPQES